MLKIRKTKKGFTLVEMVLVIAIIVILSMVIFFSVASYLGKAQSATSSVKEHNDQIETVTAEIDTLLS
ncbi:MAG: type II secretion system GspH family protein [Clostridiales bacterium]|nr:type II secretion system protein [Clostridiales bacterium]MBR6254479.1 type II secretion system protein [Clostridiales bacterium]MCR5276000.1 type II secretion system GspH family protein [Clostridiales bacterium]